MAQPILIEMPEMPTMAKKPTLIIHRCIFFYTAWLFVLLLLITVIILLIYYLT
jgi:hypothetical protein